MPNFDGALTDIKQRLAKRTTEVRKKLYLPRGAATDQGDYTTAQHLQMSRYGLTDGARRTCKSRLHHVLAHAMVLRWDDRVDFRLADMFVKTAPEKEGPMECKLLTIAFDNDKGNAQGAWRQAVAMRHVDDPTQCTHFAVALEMFEQFEQLGIGPTLEDFKPRVVSNDGEDIVEKIWFDAYFFHGVDADTKKPDGRVPSCYSTAYRECAKMHECTDPPIESKKKLHFERGVTSRQSDNDGVGLEQRKKAGRWKHNTDAHDATYAHGAPFESMRLKCGLPPP
ncbi:hypothetical protein M885DRAFT_143061 [Pelagophyceae sp. CCMP2097]|nr:hypothetical protein M885DRAFT_143061 [Pelagophyceae sp. CCMP2097]